MQCADLLDAHVGGLAESLAHPDIKVVPPGLRCFGGSRVFHGPAHTIRCRDCNVLVRSALEGPGNGRVLVVDGGGSQRCALLGDALASLAVKNGWAGVVVHGLIRDSQAIADMPVGVKALGTLPLKSDKAAVDRGQAGQGASLCGVDVAEGEFVYADWDGVIVSKRELKAPA